MTKQERIDRSYLRMAHIIALDRSKDPSTKVGAIIVAPDGRKMSGGYNGMVAGAPEPEQRWQTREDKYRHVIHAEVNAILNCPFDTVGSTIYCSLHPCGQCMKFIVQSGIKRIVHYGPMWEREPDKDIVAELSNMIEVVRYDDDPIILGLQHLYDQVQSDV